MIEALPSRRLQYRFTHELVRRSLYDGLSPVRRAELHLRVGEALERAGPPERGRPRPSLRGRGAVRGGRSAPSSTTCSPRGRRAPGLDFDAAAERLGVALELWVDGPAERARLLLELGTARHRAGRAVEAIAAFREAAEIAVELGDAELLAEAAIGYEAACWRPVITDEVAVALLERAAASLGGRAVRAARGRARRAGPGALDPRQPRARRGDAAGGDRDGPRGRRSDGARAGARGQLLGPRGHARGGGARDAHRGARPGRGGGRRRALLGGDELAGVRAGRRLRPRGGAPRGGSRAHDRGTHRAAVPAPRRRALRVGHRAVRGAPGGRRDDGGPLARVEPDAHRPRRLRRVRHPDVRRAPRAGAARGARAGGPDARGRPRRRRRRVAARSRVAARRAGDGGRGAARARESSRPTAWSRSAPPSGWPP